MDQNNTNIIYNNQKYTIPKYIINQLKEFDIEITDSYISNISKYFHIDLEIGQDNELVRLLCYDHHTRVINRKLGKIIQYNFQGNKIQSISDPKELAQIEDIDQYIFSFEKSTIIPTKIGTHFFGVNLNQIYDQFSCENLSTNALNLFIKDLFNTINNTKKMKEIYKYSNKNNLNPVPFEKFFEDYKETYLASIFYYIYRYIINSNEANKIINLDEYTYTQSLFSLLNRYSFNGKTLFHNVENLDDYKKDIGIYIFTIPKFHKYYIGQTKSSLRKRILQHFRQPTSDFDKRFGAIDIKEIYVLPCNVDLIDRIEIDCIANMPQEFLANCLSGGKTLGFIHSQSYKSNDYSLTNKQLQKILKIIEKEQS